MTTREEIEKIVSKAIGLYKFNDSHGFTPDNDFREAVDQLVELVETEIEKNDELHNSHSKGIEAKHRQQLEELEKWIIENREVDDTLIFIPYNRLLSKIKEMRSNG